MKKDIVEELNDEEKEGYEIAKKIFYEGYEYGCRKTVEHFLISMAIMYGTCYLIEKIVKIVKEKKDNDSEASNA